jgi:hypothetical protein
MPQTGRLKVQAHGNTEVELVAAYLADLTYAYSALVAFELVIERMRPERRRHYPDPFWFHSPWTFMWAPHLSWPPTQQAVASLVPPTERLILAAVELSSPGAWEFLGNLNPLEVVRKYLNDRHERRKDRDYRERAEERRLQLENLRTENEVLEQRIRIAKELGATESDLAPLLNELVIKPLNALGAYQDKGLIEGAEIVALPSPPSHSSDASSGPEGRRRSQKRR